MISQRCCSMTAPTEQRITKRFGNAGPHALSAVPDVSETRDYDPLRDASGPHALHHRQIEIAVLPDALQPVLGDQVDHDVVRLEQRVEDCALGAALHVR